jgi:hypothetical protein
MHGATVKFNRLMFVKFGIPYQHWNLSGSLLFVYIGELQRKLYTKTNLKFVSFVKYRLLSKR